MIGPKSHILVIAYSHLNRDARVKRQVDALMVDHVVHTAGFSPAGNENGSFTRLEEHEVPVNAPVVLRKFHAGMVRARRWLLRDRLKAYGAFYWDTTRRALSRSLKRLPVDLVLANDIDALPLGAEVAGDRAFFVYDAHEFSPRQQDGDSLWVKRYGGYYTSLCRTYMPTAHACFTVSDSIASAYKELTGVKPEVIWNAPQYEELRPQASLGGRVRLVHHGMASPYRNTEGLIAMMDDLSSSHELHLHLAPIADRAYREKIERSVNDRPHVHLHPALPPAELAAALNGYDIGVHYLPPTSFNHMHAMPNKLFDYVQARLAIVVSPNPAMAELVRVHKLGTVAHDFSLSALADALRELSREQIAAFKQSAHQQAFELSAYAGVERLRSTVTRLLATRSH
ncbi:MAG: glycosyltransferase [Flavobacteriales bacterium]|jgi:hypothetical protein|nr:glycosyltransferase [Flavobacteriales bacterium]